MSKLRERHREILMNVARESCQEFFARKGIHLRPVAEPTRPPAPLDLCGVVAFSGRGVRGAIVLSGAATLMRMSCPHTDAPARDWVGELANQLVGRIKHQLRRYHLDLFVTAPAVLRGEHLPPVRRGERWQVTLDCPVGVVRVWLEAQVSSSFSMLDRPDPTCSGPVEGDTLLF